VAQFAGDSCALDLRAFVPDVLALFVRQRGEKVVEIAPAGNRRLRVRPMELPVEPLGASRRL
jgi:hypothetical protein